MLGRVVYLVGVVVLLMACTSTELPLEVPLKFRLSQIWLRGRPLRRCSMLCLSVLIVMEIIVWGKRWRSTEIGMTGKKTMRGMVYGTLAWTRLLIEIAIQSLFTGVSMKGLEA